MTKTKRGEKMVRTVRVFFLVLSLTIFAYAQSGWSKAVSEESGNLLSVETKNELKSLSILVKGSYIDIHTAVYLDIDNDEDTGYLSPLWKDTGMDYLVEDNKLFKSTGKKWGWRYIGKVKYQKDENSFLVVISKNLLENFEENFKVGVTQSDKNWHRSAKIPSSPLFYEKSTEKWRTVALDNKGNELKSIMVADKEDKLKFLIEGKNITSHTAIYLDVDSDKDSGYLSPLWKNTGMDYLIEDNRLFKSTGKKWGWEFVTKVEYAKDKDTLFVCVDKYLLDNLGENFKVGVTESDGEWKFVTKIPSSFIAAKYYKNSQDLSGFEKIRSLIEKAATGELNDVVYICVGDSTRADDYYYGGGYLFELISKELSKYNVNSRLQAVSGYTAKEYARGVYYPSWTDTVSEIPGDGSDAIVDISLGINDARYYGALGKAENIKSYLKDAMDKILSYKPKTNFMLTMPNRMIGYDDLVKEYEKAYEELAKERNLPLVDTRVIFDTGYPNWDLYRDMDAHDYGANKRIHLSKLGQKKVAELILSKILP